MNNSIKYFRKVSAGEIWTDGNAIIVLGSPPDEDEKHDCDQMGCGYCHVLIRGTVDLFGFTFEKLVEEEPKWPNYPSMTLCRH